MDLVEQPPAADDRCGTLAGHRAHLNHRTKPCQPCVEASRAYRGAWDRARTRLTQVHHADFVAILAEERAKAEAGAAR